MKRIVLMTTDPGPISPVSSAALTARTKFCDETFNLISLPQQQSI